MNGILPNIPRFYTAFAEWGACLVYLMFISRRITGWRFAFVATGALIIQSLTLVLTGNLPTGFWIPCMAAAIMVMFLFLRLCGNTDTVDAGYYCARAFVLAEFAASLGWQIYCYFWPLDNAPKVVKISLLLAVCFVVFFLIAWLEKRYVTQEGRFGVTKKELLSVVCCHYWRNRICHR